MLTDRRPLLSGQFLWDLARSSDPRARPLHARAWRAALDAPKNARARVLHDYVLHDYRANDYVLHDYRAIWLGLYAPQPDACERYLAARVARGDLPAYITAQIAAELVAAHLRPRGAARRVQRLALAWRPAPAKGQWYVPENVPDLIRERLHACARGCYQARLLRAGACWSGADLRGRARDYGSRYRDSRRNLLARVQDTLSRYGWSAARVTAGKRMALALQFAGHVYWSW